MSPALARRPATDAVIIILPPVADLFFRIASDACLMAMKQLFRERVV